MKMLRMMLILVDSFVVADWFLVDCVVVQYEPLT